MGDTNADIHIPATYGALLLGSLFAMGFSGIVAVQSIKYYRLYPDDNWKYKALVSTVWGLDIFHSVLICASMWYYMVAHWGDTSRIDVIPWPIAFTVLITALTTFLVHCFFAGKILKSSRNNYYIVVPIVLLAFLRSFAACVTTVEMTYLAHYSDYAKTYPGWVFTTGLTLSAVVDLLIMGFLCYYLRELRGRMGSTTMIKLVDTLTLYTLENGALTCIAATASLICWLAMHHNLVFLGIHFVITKLYANSLLASLNTRKELRTLRTTVKSSGWGPDKSDPGLAENDFVAPFPPRRVTALQMRHPLELYRPGNTICTTITSGYTKSHRYSGLDYTPAQKTSSSLHRQTSESLDHDKIETASLGDSIIWARQSVDGGEDIVDEYSPRSASLQFSGEPSTLEWRSLP